MNTTSISKHTLHPHTTTEITKAVTAKNTPKLRKVGERI